LFDSFTDGFQYRAAVRRESESGKVSFGKDSPGGKDSGICAEGMRAEKKRSGQKENEELAAGNTLIGKFHDNYLRHLKV
jgi:hypothetical protein